MDHGADGSPSTTTAAYSERLSTLSGARWKRLLNVQAPYRWNVRRLTSGRVLDVGCGIGRNLAALPDAVGVDHNATSVQAARAAGHMAYTSQEWAGLDASQRGLFDTMLLAHVAEHMTAEQAEELIRDYLPAIRGDGRIVVICPQQRGYASDATHVQYMDRATLAGILQRSGFDVERTLSFPLPAIAGRVFTYNETIVTGRRRP